MHRTTWPPLTIPALALILLLTLAQTSRASLLTPVEQDYLKNHGTVTFVSQSSYPPFEFKGKDGDHNGMCVELARWMATQLGFQAQFMDTSFKKAQEAVLGGQADVLTSFFYSEKRDRYFDFTSTMFEVPASIFVAADRPDIKGIEDLNGKIIAMQKGDYAQEFLEQKGISFRVVYTSNFAEATNLVIAGKADAIIGDEQIVLYHIYASRLTEMIKKVGQPLYIGRNCMAVREGQAVLLGILQKGLRLARQHGVLDNIYRKWLGQRYTAGKTFFSEYLPWIILLAAVGVALGLVIWLWNIRLRAEVAKQTDELIRSEGTLRTILAASPVGIGLVEQSRIDWANPAMSAMLGYGSDELLGMEVSRLYTSDQDYENSRLAVRDALRETPWASVEVQWRRKDGSTFDCLLRYAPILLGRYEKMAITIAEDITERKQAQISLSQAHDRLEATLSALPDLLFDLDPHGRILDCRVPEATPPGLLPEPFLGKLISEVLPPNAADTIMSCVREAAVKGQCHSVVYPIEIEGQKYWYEISVGTAGAGKSQPQRLVALARDITARVEAQEARQETEELLRAAIEAIDEAFAIFDAEDRLVMYNPKYREIYKESEDLLVPGAFFEDILRQGAARGQYADAEGREEQWVAERMARHRQSNSSLEQHLSDGRWLKISERKTSDGGSVGFRVDITELKRSEERAKAALREKETLLKEIHHRVKNNLAVVSGLLSLQARRQSDDQVRGVFEQCQNRLQAMALIHETLYQSDSLSQVDLQEYSRSLVSRVVGIYAGAGGKVDFDIAAQGVKLDISQAVPCGIIINELVTNSLKHAFADGRDGRIGIQAQYVEPQGIRLSVTDNGVGLGPRAQDHGSQSLGMRLVSLMVDQLNGTLKVNSGQGLTVSITWPEPSREQDA